MTLDAQTPIPASADVDADAWRRTRHLPPQGCPLAAADAPSGRGVSPWLGRRCAAAIGLAAIAWACMAGWGMLADAAPESPASQAIPGWLLGLLGLQTALLLGLGLRQWRRPPARRRTDTAGPAAEGPAHAAMADAADAADAHAELFAHSPDGMLVVDANGRIVDANPAAVALFAAHDRAALLGLAVEALIPQEFRERHVLHRQQYQQGVRHGVARGRPMRRAGPAPQRLLQAAVAARRAGAEPDGGGAPPPTELQALPLDGTPVPVEIGLVPVRAHGHHGPCTIAVVRDVSARRRVEQALLRAATLDPLTGLPNRQLLYERALLVLADSARSGRPAAVMLLDLDDFKAVNDSLGHAAGDELLLRVAARLQQAVRPHDTVARLGGDEFAVLLADLDGQGGSVQAVVQRIANALGAHTTVLEHEVAVAASIGVAMFPRDGRTMAELLRKADIAMYRAKAQARGGVAFFVDDDEQQAREALKLQAALSRALPMGELHLAWQAQVDATGGTLVGAEVLLRWTHAGQPVSPGRFIPLAERSGSIVTIGRWVLQQACRQAAAWACEGRLLPRLAVNVSARQLSDPDFADDVLAALVTSGWPPQRLELELTESALMADPPRAAACLLALRERGVVVAVDDFGTGQSSLSYLRQLPLDALKIDRSFVRDLTSHADAATIAQAVLALAEALGLRAVAEGVETRAQRDWLVARGCPVLQGWLFGQATTAGQFAQRWLPPPMPPVGAGEPPAPAAPAPADQALSPGP